MPRPQIQSLAERLCPSSAYAGRGICVAVIDAGFYPHPDLLQPRSRIRAYVDVTRDDALRAELLSRRPWSWHGTMTACCAVGNGYLSGGRYRSLAYESDVVLIKAGDDADGSVSGKSIAAALRLPVHHPELGVRVISISVGADEDDPDAEDVERAAAAAVRAGIVVVAAAGNVPGEAPRPPASAARVVTVGGLDDRNTRDPSDDVPWPSSYGETHPGVHKPDVVAPAIWVPAPMVPGTLQAREAHALYDLLTVLEEMQIDPPEDPRARESAADLLEVVDARIALQKYIAPDYQHVDGTSFAAPVVAGIVAQMLEASPRLGVEKVREGLRATARRLEGVPDEQQGAGVVDALAAVKWAERG